MEEEYIKKSTDNSDGFGRLDVQVTLLPSQCLNASEVPTENMDDPKIGMRSTGSFCFNNAQVQVWSVICDITHDFV